jgi:hypothetical protein
MSIVPPNYVAVVNVIVEMPHYRCDRSQSEASQKPADEKAAKAQHRQLGNMLNLASRSAPEYFFNSPVRNQEDGGSQNRGRRRNAEPTSELTSVEDVDLLKKKSGASGIANFSYRHA